MRSLTQVVPNPVPVVIQDNDLPTATLIAGTTASEVFSEPSYFTVQLNAPLPTNSAALNVNYRLVGVVRPYLKIKMVTAF